MPSSNPDGERTRPTVLAYYFPDWHPDDRNSAWFGAGWTEWDLVRAARPRFDGHRQPRVPVAGYQDESDPAVVAQQIDLAADHGVDGFLVDFYWYDDGPYLEGALDTGLTRAPNVDRIEFALMWANHDLVDIFPSKAGGEQHGLLKGGALDRPAFDAMAAHIVEHYFSHPSYLTVDGRPWFSIYEIGNFIEGLGGVAEARDALDSLDARARAAGFPGVHVDAVVWGISVLPGGHGLADPADVLAELGVRSATSYVWIHHSDPAAADFPRGDWSTVRRDAFADYERLAARLEVPMFPNVTVGWDSSPRTRQDVPFDRGDYPWIPVWDPSPDEFRDGLVAAREFSDRTGAPHPVVTINAWNEWTEGSYLLPDTSNGTAYLEAVRNVFGRAEQNTRPEIPKGQLHA